MNKIVMYFCGLAIVLLVFACNSGAEKNEIAGNRPAGNDTRTSSANMMAHFVLPSAVDGTLIDSDAYKGRVRLINFFATWCPPCMEEIPSLITLAEKYGDSGFSVIGLSVDQSGEAVKKYVNKMKITYPVLMSDDEVRTSFGGITGIPVSFLVARDGTLLRRYMGFVDHRVLEKDIEEVLDR